MLPRPDAPATRLPYTTADMAERLAKKKAEQDAAAQAQANQALRFGVTNPPVREDKGGGGGWLSQVGNMAKSLVLTPAGTALDMIPYVANIPGVKGEGAWGYEPEDIGTSNFFQAGGQALEQSGRRLVGDVTAIPGLGKDSPSYTADQIRKYGVAEGLASAGLDYGNLALTAAPFVKPTGMAIGNAINDAKYAAYLRRTKSPFPDVVPPRPGTFIDVVEDSRLPASTQRALPPAEIAPAIAETPASRLAPPAFRERPVSASSRLTVETVGGQNFDGTLNTNASRNIIIRSFNQATGEYTGVITLRYDPGAKTATVQGLGATNPIVTPQLISAAATEIRKLVGDVQYPLIPSNSLSAYSRPFVERLQQAGLIDPSYKIPETNMMNTITKLQGPETFAKADLAGGGFGQTVIDPLSYQPTYNDVLKALVESRRQAKLAGETGRLNTSSKRLETLKYLPPGLNDAAAYRVNMRILRIPEHPLLKQMSDNEFDSLMREIYTNPGLAAKKLIDMWEKIKPSEELGMWADNYANTPENLKKFPDLLKDAYLINQPTRDRLMSQLDAYLTFGEY